GKERLLPSILAALLALLLVSRRSTAAPGYGYAVATLGVVIGADFFHLPEIFSQPFMGSVGGAGLYDMVYIAGLLAIVLVLPFMHRGIKRRPFRSSDPHFLLSRAQGTSDGTMARHMVVRAVREKLIRLGVPPDEASLRRLLGRRAAHDFRLLHNRPVRTADGARAAWTTGSLLVDALDKLERRRYASALRRTVAFLVDAIILAFLSLLPALLSGFSEVTMFFVFFFSLQLLYFTGMEYVADTTVGKGLLGMTVTTERGGSPDFMTAFTRNIIRFFDMLLLGYLVSLIMIGFTGKKQRLGDIVAGTVVVKNR
ncbi:MAG: RDD family protein, partial [Candidatus Thermoplasmatota archaeon]|nr:RDD family protein [Candidatus Thermoplasmatota archaeon]